MLYQGAAQSVDRANWWAFGDTAGLSFASGSPVLWNTSIETIEGCATISDEQGNLILYTDGTDVWNSQHTITPNGDSLKGSSTSTNSAVVVPHPGDTTLYYIFTASWDENVGIHFSIFDITLDNGLGDVDPNQKNIPLLTGTRENLTALRHINMHDYWLVTHLTYSNQLAAFRIGHNGLITNPVISTSGPNVIGAGVGTIKASPNSQYVGICSATDNYVRIMRFNRQTGQVIKSRTFSTPNHTYVYGLEFSPDSKQFYVSDGYNPNGNITQHRIKPFTWQHMLSSEYLIPETADYGALQLGPDLKIYIATYEHVSTIHDPNSLDSACNFDLNHVITYSARLGLPQFTSSFFHPDIEATSECRYDSILFRVDTFGIDSVVWNFGDPGSGILNTSTDPWPYHVYTDTGTFEIYAALFNEGFIDTVRRELTVYPRQSLDLGSDTAVCIGDSVTYNVEQPFAAYIWHNGSTEPSITIASDSTISVTVNGVCDTIIDTVTIDFDSIFAPRLGPDTMICDNDTLTLASGHSDSLVHIWSNFDTNNAINVIDEGEYWVTVSNGRCTYGDTIEVAHHPSFFVEMEDTTNLCVGKSVTITPYANDTCSWLWSNGSTEDSLVTDSTGVFSVTGFNGVCHDRARTHVVQRAFAAIDLPNDTAICKNDTIVFNLDIDPHTSLKWSSNTTQTRASFIIFKDTLITLTSSRYGCEKIDSISVRAIDKPMIDLPKTISICSNDTLHLNKHGNIGYDYKWNTGDTTKSLLVRTPGTYNVRVSDENCINHFESDVLHLEHLQSLLMDSVYYCLGDELKLTAFDEDKNNIDALWSTGETGSSIYVDEPNTYLVELTDQCTTLTDSTKVLPCKCRVYSPNAFTPNNDGKNEAFSPVINCDPYFYDFRVYNRWGEEIFQSSSPSEQWDGTYQNTEVLGGIYSWVLNFNYINEFSRKNAEQVYGKVVLIRN
ncbi:MAG: gliding motility-associated C-terminal domain-containing protein [Salibacteraceae bacterium]